MDTAVLAELGASTRLDLSVADTAATDLPQQVKDAVTAASATAAAAVPVAARRAGGAAHHPEHLHPSHQTPRPSSATQCFTTSSASRPSS